MMKGMHSKRGYMGEQREPKEYDRVGQRIQEGISQEKRRKSKATRGRRRQENI